MDYLKLAEFRYRELKNVTVMLVDAHNDFYSLRVTDPIPNSTFRIIELVEAPTQLRLPQPIAIVGLAHSTIPTDTQTIMQRALRSIRPLDMLLFVTLRSDEVLGYYDIIVKAMFIYRPSKGL